MNVVEMWSLVVSIMKYAEEKWAVREVGGNLGWTSKILYQRYWFVLYIIVAGKKYEEKQSSFVHSLLNHHTQLQKNNSTYLPWSQEHKAVFLYLQRQKNYIQSHLCHISWHLWLHEVRWLCRVRRPVVRVRAIVPRACARSHTRGIPAAHRYRFHHLIVDYIKTLRIIQKKSYWDFCGAIATSDYKRDGCIIDANFSRGH